MTMPMKNDMNSADKIWLELAKNYGDAKCSLIKDTPYRLCIRGILSAQCTDAKVNVVTNKLFEIYKTPEDIYNLDVEILSEMIRPCGLYKIKSRGILEFTTLYLTDWNKEIPRDTKTLEKCAGIGHKIANLIVSEVYNIPKIVVDTHCMRVSRRLGLTENTTPKSVEDNLMLLYTKDKWINLGHRLIALGRDYCKAQKPLCDKCPMSKLCRKNFITN